MKSLVQEVLQSIGPIWAMKIRQAMLEAGHTLDDKTVTLVLYQGMFPRKPSHKTRLQAAYEKRRERNDLARCYAVRAVSGHRPCKILNPIRVCHGAE